MSELELTLLFIFVLLLLLGTGVWVGLALLGVAYVGMELFTSRPPGDGPSREPPKPRAGRGSRPRGGEGTGRYAVRLCSSSHAVTSPA